MDSIRSIWIVLQTDAVLFCHEGPQDGIAGEYIMPLSRFQRVLGRARQLGWACTLVCNRNGLPDEYARECGAEVVDIIVPAGSRLPPDDRTTVVYESDRFEHLGEEQGSKAILRVYPADLDRISNMMQLLATWFDHVLIRHPEMLSYGKQEFDLYGEQLRDFCQWLLKQPDIWARVRIPNLMGGFQGSTYSGCGAGVSSVAVVPSGDMFVCPAAAVRGDESCGHIDASLTLRNRQLFKREWSVTCQECEALQCERCVDINKRGTLEYCVPPANACVLAHVELDAQAWLAQEANCSGLWNDAWKKPSRPTIHDPYQTVKANGSIGGTEVWRCLMSFDEDPTMLTGAAMLHIMHVLQGHCEAVWACCEAAVQLL